MLKPQRIPQKKLELSTQKRLRLIDTLNQLPLSQFLKVEVSLQVPPEPMPALNGRLCQRSARLLTYLESPVGPGLTPLLEALAALGIKSCDIDSPRHKKGLDLQFGLLQQANLSDANLLEANLTEANLQQANLRHAILLEANLYRVDLSYASLRGANLQQTNLRKANLHRADLSQVNLSQSMLQEACLNRANLSAAYLRNANLFKTDLRGAIVKAATFGNNLGLTEQDKSNLKRQGAIFQESPNLDVLGAVII